LDSYVEKGRTSLVTSSHAKGRVRPEAGGGEGPGSCYGSHPLRPAVPPVAGRLVEARGAGGSASIWGRGLGSSLSNLFNDMKRDAAGGWIRPISGLLTGPSSRRGLPRTIRWWCSWVSSARTPKNQHRNRAPRPLGNPEWPSRLPGGGRARRDSESAPTTPGPAGVRRTRRPLPRPQDRRLHDFSTKLGIDYRKEFQNPEAGPAPRRW